MATTLAKKPKPSETGEKVPAERQVLVRPEKCVINSEGFHFRALVAWLPRGATQDDLRDPKIWKQVMKFRGLQTHDRLTCMAHDETWLSECYVISVDGSSATLRVGKVMEYREAPTGLWSNDEYHLEYSGGRYIVVRKEDDCVIRKDGFATQNEARAFVVNTLTKTKVGDV